MKVYILLEDTYITTDDYGESVYSYQFYDIKTEKEFKVFLETNSWKYNLDREIVQDHSGFERYKVLIKAIKGV